MQVDERTRSRSRSLGFGAISLGLIVATASADVGAPTSAEPEPHATESGAAPPQERTEGTGTGTATEGAMAAEEAPAPRFEGTFRLGVPAESAREAIDEAIEIAIVGMGAIRRPIARRRLRARNSVFETVTFQQSQGRIAVQLDDQRFIAPADGRLVETTLHDGERIRLSHRIEGDRLVQRFVGEDGERLTVYHLRPDGGALRVYNTVKSGQLPQDVKYMLPYSRGQ